MTLELSAMRWLWLEQKCLVVLEQRSPSYMMGQPDVLGITPGRYMTEVEVKRSVSDFRADAQKRHRINREHYLPSQPRQFYYLAPAGVAEKIQLILPPWAGLMTVDNVGSIVILQRAPVNAESKKLNVKQCARLSRCMTSHMMGHAYRAYSVLERWKNHDDTFYIDWVKPEKGTYEI